MPDAKRPPLLARPQEQKALRRRLVAAERKLLFFLSWANDQPPEVYDTLALATAAEHEKHVAALGAGPAVGPAAAAMAAQQASGKPAVLIEEL